MLAAAGITLLVIATGLMQDICTSGRIFFQESVFIHDWVSYSNSAFSLSILIWVAPITAAVACSWMFCEDYTTGFLRLKLSRQRLSDYCTATALEVGFCGGVALAMPFALWMLLCFLLLRGEADMNFLARHCLGSGIVYVLGQTALLFTCGALWALVGLVASTYLINKYAAMAVPMILFLGLTQILIRLTGNSFYLSDLMNIAAPQSCLVRLAVSVALLLALGLWFWRRCRKVVLR